MKVRDSFRPILHVTGVTVALVIDDAPSFDELLTRAEEAAATSPLPASP